LQRAVKSALVYPVGVLSVAGGVITLLLWKVVPIFATLFAGLGVDLPLPTKIVITLSNFVGSIFWFAHSGRSRRWHLRIKKPGTELSKAVLYLIPSS